MSEALPLILTRSPTVDDESLPSTTRTSSLKLVGGIALFAFALAAVVARTRAATTPNLIADQTLDEPEGFLALVDSPTASPTQCVATYGKCGGGIWTEHVGHSCCDPADTCYWKRGSAVKDTASAYAQCRPSCPDGWECSAAPTVALTYAPTSASVPEPTSKPTSVPAPAPTVAPGDPTAKPTLPPPTAAPTSGSGHQFTSKSELSTAIDAWVADPSSATATYGHIAIWDTSLITDFDQLFSSKKTFNDDISGWDVGAVTTFERCFDNADAFNQPIGVWDTHSATKMGAMFFHADDFNQDLSAWDVSAVTQMHWMFWATPSLDQSWCWDTPSLTENNNFCGGGCALQYCVGE